MVVRRDARIAGHAVVQAADHDRPRPSAGARRGDEGERPDVAAECRDHGVVDGLAPVRAMSIVGLGRVGWRPRTAAGPDGEIKHASETVYGDTNGLGRHMPAVSHAVGQVLQRRRRLPDAMPNKPDQGDAISRAKQFRRRGGEMTRCRIHVHERCPAERASGWA